MRYLQQRYETQLCLQQFHLQQSKCKYQNLQMWHQIWSVYAMPDKRVFQKS